MEWSSGRFNIFFKFSFSSHLLVTSEKKNRAPELHVHTRMSAPGWLVAAGRKDFHQSPGKYKSVDMHVGGGTTGTRDRPSSQSNRTEFWANRTSSLTSNKRFCHCTFQWGMCNDRRNLDFDNMLTRHMMVLSFLHTGIFKVKEHARNKYPHTLQHEPQQMSHLQTFCFYVRLIKILTSVLYDCKHWNKVLFFINTHTPAWHSVFIFNENASANKRRLTIITVFPWQLLSAAVSHNFLRNFVQVAGLQKLHRPH